MKSIINNVNIFFVGNYYERSGSTITKHYYPPPPPSAPPPNATIKPQLNYRLLTWSHLGEAGWGSQSMVVEYFLGDHLGSTSITTDTAGAKVSEMRYKSFGEVRYTWKDATLTQTTPAYALTKWTSTLRFAPSGLRPGKTPGSSTSALTCP